MLQSQFPCESPLSGNGDNGKKGQESSQSKPVISEERRAYLRRYYRRHRAKLQEYQREYNRVHKKKIRFDSHSGYTGQFITKDSYNLGDIMKASPERAARMINQIVRGDRSFSVAHRIG